MSHDLQLFISAFGGFVLGLIVCTLEDMFDDDFDR